MRDDDKTQSVCSQTYQSMLKKAQRLPPSLVLLVGPAGLVGKHWLLDQHRYLIGRSFEAEICISDRSLSRKHALIRVEAEEVLVEDIGSANGTQVEGVMLSRNQPVVLASNNYIQAGDVVFKYLHEGSIEAIASQASFERGRRDALTDCYSKGAFLQEAPLLFARAVAAGQPLSLMIFDLDYFKAVNDSYGHQAGDLILRETCKRVRSHLRPGDFFARYGGEEFVIMLGNTELAVALEIAERLRACVDNHAFVCGLQRLNASISVGVAERQQQISDWQSLFELGDQALYQAKQLGRNQIRTLQHGDG